MNGLLWTLAEHVLLDLHGNISLHVYTDVATALGDRVQEDSGPRMTKNDRQLGTVTKGRR